MFCHEPPEKYCQVPCDAVAAFVTAHTPAGISSSIEWEGDGVSPCLVPIDTPAYQALTNAISAAFDGLPVLPTREGGSGPEYTQT